MAAKQKDVDWVAIEREFRTGLKSNRAIGTAYGVSDMAIRKRAKRDEWTKDLSAAIREKTEQKVRRAAVRTKVRKEGAANDKEVVEANSNLAAATILSHRSDLAILKKTIVGMAGELGALSNTELQEALELVLDEKIDKASDAYRNAMLKAFAAAMALGGRSSAGKNLVMSLGLLIDKERQAFGIDKVGSEGDLSAYLKQLDPPPA